MTAHRQLGARAPRRRFGVLGRRLLIAFLLASLLPLALSMIAGYLRSRAIVAGLMAENVGKTAQIYAADVDGFLEDQRMLLRTLPAGPPPLDRPMARAVESTPQLDALLLLGPDGEPLASYGGFEGWARGACRQLMDRPGDAMTHAGAGHAHEVIVAVPHEPTGGVLCGRVTFTVHQEMMTTRARSMVGGEAYIVDRSGTVVCHAQDEGEPHVEMGSPLGEVETAIAAAGVPWFGVLDRPEGPQYAAFAPARGLPWGVWVAIPPDLAPEALAPLVRDALIFAGLFVIALVGVVVLLVRRLVGPVEEVVSAAGAIAEGRYGETLPVRGDDEIARLLRAFNRMSLALRESYARLDERVARRTRELRAARDFSDLLLDTMEQRILVIDRELNIIRANVAAQRAYGEDVVGQSCGEVHRRHGADGAICPARRVFERGEAEAEERVYERGDQKEVLAVETIPMAVAGEIEAVIEIARDVTDLRQLQARLAHQEKMAALGVLSAGLAHEIGNPLASMSSELEMIERFWDPEEARRSIPVLRAQIRRIAGLLRELVDFGRQPRDAVETLSPEAVVDDVIRLLSHDPRSRGVAIGKSVEREDLSLCTNRDRLIQVLLNLGLNALDALGGAGSLDFGIARGPGDEVWLEVRDSGPGLRADVAERVFEPFYTTKPPGRGTGLGLFVSERIIDQLGGRIALRTREGEGTTFTVALPRCVCEGGHPEPGCDCPGGEDCE